MSKLSLIELSDQHFTPKLISSLVEAFRLNASQFPTALLVTQAQAERHFYEAGQVMSNFQGIPIEVEQKANEKTTVVKTINGILSGLHKSNATDVSHVYSMLEKMKDIYV